MEVTCPECSHTFDAELQTDDWGDIDEDVTCEKCSETFNFAPDAHDDYDDSDAMYESWRDSQLDD